MSLSRFAARFRHGRTHAPADPWPGDPWTSSGQSDDDLLLPPRDPGPPPPVSDYSEDELYIAAAISCVAPMDKRHPEESLPLARAALRAVGELKPC